MEYTRFNVWPYDRLDAACTEPATHAVQADNGGRYVVCDGHALAAHTQITGGQVLPGLPAVQLAHAFGNCGAC